jgi:hypothetical protein
MKTEVEKYDKMIADKKKELLDVNDSLSKNQSESESKDKD